MKSDDTSGMLVGLNRGVQKNTAEKKEDGADVYLIFGYGSSMDFNRNELRTFTSF